MIKWFSNKIKQAELNAIKEIEAEKDKIIQDLRGLNIETFEVQQIAAEKIAKCHLKKKKENWKGEWGNWTDDIDMASID